MPADYEACRDALIKKGVSSKTAKRRCAIWFYKKHGVSVNEAHKKAKGSFEGEPELDEEDWSIMELMASKLEDIKCPEMSAEASTLGDSLTFDVEAANLEFLDEYGVVEIIATRVGAAAFTTNKEAVVWTDKALSKMAHTWKYGNVSINHNHDRFYGVIIDSFYDNGVVRQVVKVNDELKGWLKKFGTAVGVSIEATKVRLGKKMNILDAKGTGVTFIFPPTEPACPTDDGCGIVASLPVVPALDEADEPGIIPEVDVTNRPANPWESVYEDDGIRIKMVVSPDNNIEAPIKEEPSPNLNTNESEVETMVEEKKDVKIEEVKAEQPKAEVPQVAEVKAEEPKTVCAKKYEADVKSRDEEISMLKKNLETVKAELTKFEDAKKNALLETIKSEGLDIESYRSEPIPVLEKVVGGIEAFKKKLEKTPEVNSGATIIASEQKTDPSGQAMSKAVEEAKTEATDAALERAWAKASEQYGIKRPKQ